MTVIDSFTVTPAEVVAGEPVTVAWQTTDAAEVRLNGEVVPLDGQIEDVPTVDKTYLLEAFPAPAPAVTQSINVVVSEPPPPPPPPGNVPSWVANAVVGKVFRVPGSSYIAQSVKDQYTVPHVDLVANTSGSSSPDYAIGAVHLHSSSRPRIADIFGYSGPAFDPVEIAFYFFGGGHSAKIGNEVLKLAMNVESPAVEVVGQPSHPDAISICSNGAHIPPLSFDVTSFNQQRYHLDGKPLTGHMTTRTIYMPQDKGMWKILGGPAYFGSGGSSNIDRFDTVTKQWGPPRAYSQDGGWSQFTPAPTMPNDYRNYAVPDYRDDTAYFIGHVTGRVYKWGGPAAPLSLEDYGSLPEAFTGTRFYVWPSIIDTTRNQIVVATGGNGGAAKPLRITRLDLATKQKTISDVTWKTGVTPVDFWYGHSIAHDTDADRYLIWTGGNYLYTVDAATLEVDRLDFAPDGDQLPTNRFWTLGRMQYVPLFKGVVLQACGPKDYVTLDGTSLHFLKLN